MLNQPILRGKTITLGDNRISQGRVWVARRANEATAEYGMPEGAILVLQKGNDINSHVARLCAEHNVPCIVNASGITGQVKRNDYLQVNTREGTVQKFNPGFFGKGSNFNHRVRYSQEDTLDNTNDKSVKKSLLQNATEMFTRPFKRELPATSFGHDTTLQTQRDNKPTINQPQPNTSTKSSANLPSSANPEHTFNSAGRSNIFKNSSNVLNAIEAEKHGQDMTHNIKNSE